MKRSLKKYPKIQLFKEQASPITKNYDEKLLQILFRIVVEIAFISNKQVQISSSLKKKVKEKLKKQKLYLLHQDRILQEMLDYLNLHYKICHKIQKEVQYL